MSNNFALHLPLNSVSFGQVSFCILRELYERKLYPCIFPIGDKVEISTQSGITEDLATWIKENRDKAHIEHSRKTPIIKLWHLTGSLESYSERQILLTFYELDSPTPYEINVAKNNKTVFTSKYSKEVFADAGAESEYIPLGFDKWNFYKTDRDYFPDRITFNVVGKFEKRKHHARIIKAWLEKYGNNPDYFLQCAIHNPFFSDEDNLKIRANCLQGKEYYNVQFFDFFETNDQYNDFLNSGNVIIGMSGGEGWGLPEFHSVALGKHSVILNASAYKGWANEKNSVLVHPCGKWPAEDGTFFKKGTAFNQGEIYTFSEGEFIEACDQATERVRKNTINDEGLKLQSDFSYTSTVDQLLKLI